MLHSRDEEESQEARPGLTPPPSVPPAEVLSRRTVFSRFCSKRRPVHTLQDCPVSHISYFHSLQQCSFIKTERKMGAGAVASHNISNKI